MPTDVELMHCSMDIDEHVDLSDATVEESCYWLIDILRLDLRLNDAYTIPYINYVTTWKHAIPLSAIVIAQSPYPNPIFSRTSAAMSYDEELCKRVMKLRVPPTVRVLANDLFIHAGVDREVTISTIREGWRLVDNGVLIINASAVTIGDKNTMFRECMYQLNVVIKLLRETEKVKQGTVDIIAYGEGRLMATEITKCFRSRTLRLVKYLSDHPAKMSYKFDDLDDKDCHLGMPSTSKALARHIRNRVAETNTMGRPSKSDRELEERRLQEYINTLTRHGVLLEESANDLADKTAKIADAMSSLDENDRLLMQDLSGALAVLARRVRGYSAHLIARPDTDVFRGYGLPIGRSAPSLGMISPTPSSTSLTSSVGTNATIRGAASPSPPPRKLPTYNVKTIGTIDEKVKETEPTTPDTTKGEKTETPSTSMSRRNSVTSAKSSRGGRKLMKHLPDGTKVRLTDEEIEEYYKLLAAKQNEKGKKTEEAKGEAKEAGRAESVGESNDYGFKLWSSLDKRMRDQLSGIGSVVESVSRRDVLSDDCTARLDMIQESIVSKSIANDITLQAVIAIQHDINELGLTDTADIPFLDSPREYEVYKLCDNLF